MCPYDGSVREGVKPLTVVLTDNTYADLVGPSSGSAEVAP
jgi:hypothetical protein